MLHASGIGTGIDSGTSLFLLESESEISIKVYLAGIGIRVLSFPGIEIEIKLYPESCITGCWTIWTQLVQSVVQHSPLRPYLLPFRGEPSIWTLVKFSHRFSHKEARLTLPLEGSNYLFIAWMQFQNGDLYSNLSQIK